MSADAGRRVPGDARPASDRHFERAFGLHREGRHREAFEQYETLLAHDPRHAGALHYSALILHQAGHTQDALVRIEHALAIDPRSSDIWSNAALVYMAVGRNDDARRALEAALSREPTLAEAWLNLASLRLQDGDAAGAEAAARRALSRADTPQGWFNLALALTAQARQAEALDALDRVDAGGTVADDDAAVPGLRAQLLVALGRGIDAKQVLDRALAQVDHPALRIERARLHDAAGYTSAAVADYEAALARDADDEIALSELVFLKKRYADWTGLPALQDQFRARVVAHGRDDAASALTPFSLLSDPSTRAEQRMAGLAWSRRFNVDATPRPLSAGRIRVGYLSADFHEHATGVLAVGLFEQHDRDAFEVIGYSTGRDDGSALRRRLVASFDKFVDAEGWTQQRLADTILADGIDILVDLKGHTDGAPTAAVAARPAPIQVAYLGYPATTGASFIDYLIGDAIVTPEEHAGDFSETLVQLPASYQVNDHRRVADETPPRAQLGLPDDAFVHCSFNNVYKIGPDVFDAWMEILRASDDSVLWLLTPAKEVDTRARLRAEATARGIAGERIVFADHRPHAAYLGLYGAADLFLDTWPYNAHTTASDALWMGCPLVTVLGETFAGRVAASLLTAADMPQWIAVDRAGYVAQAVDAAARGRASRASRTGMRDAIRASALFDTRATTRAIEGAYRTMVAQHREGRRASFRVPPSPSSETP